MAYQIEQELAAEVDAHYRRIRPKGSDDNIILGYDEDAGDFVRTLPLDHFSGISGDMVLQSDGIYTKVDALLWYCFSRWVLHSPGAKDNLLRTLDLLKSRRRLLLILGAISLSEPGWRHFILHLLSVPRVRSPTNSYWIGPFLKSEETIDSNLPIRDDTIASAVDEIDPICAYIDPERFRSYFLKFQEIALRMPLLVIHHIRFSSRDLIPLRHIDNLGRGAYSIVDRVQNKQNHQVLARKVFRPSHRRAAAISTFENEISLLRKLQRHHHIVCLVGSYVADNELGILTLPVAETNLHEFLQSLSGRRSNDAQSKVLWQSVGCLISGLHFIHASSIRHKDINPHNILVHGENVLFTDFGLAFDFSAFDTSNTAGVVSGLTRRYAAREVVEEQGRNRKSDIFSLGCVFLEVLAVQRGISLDEQDEKIFEAISSQRPRSYCYVLPSIMDWISRYEVVDSKLDVYVARICRQMLQDNAQVRPSTETFLKEIFVPGFREGQGLACAKCKHKADLTDYQEQLRILNQLQAMKRSTY